MANNATSSYSPKEDKELMTRIWSPEIRENPYNFVMFAFPWGKEGTPLERYKGPRAWQKEVLLEVANHIKENKERVANGEAPKVLHMAISSGRGIGKSSLTAWFNYWFLSTVLGGSAVTTANTEHQLKSRTWAELGKWHTMAINSHWFERTALSIIPAKWFKDALTTQLKVDDKYYYGQAQLWSEENPDAFAGLHNDNGVLLQFDESSGVPEVIWRVSKGFFTEPTIHRYFFAYSNPRRNTGAFYECFHKNRKRWVTKKIDSRTVEGVDIESLQSIIDEYGEDSDEARVEVKGEFPKQGESQFISRDIINGALERKIETDDYAALMMGIDIARYGNDQSVIAMRRGRDARSIEPIKLTQKDNMEVANTVAYYIDKYAPDAVCIDAGNGTGVIDRLREMGYKVHEVWFGSKSSKAEYANKRTEIWGDMREWLKGGCILNDQNLIDDLAGPQYKFRGASDKIMLESKEEMKKRGVASPDYGDALACTFAVRVARSDMRSARRNRRESFAQNTDYDIFG